MDLDFLIPAAAFAFTAGVLSAWAWYRDESKSTTSGPLNRYFVLMTVSATVAILSWLVFRFFSPQLYPRSEGEQVTAWWVGLSYFGAMIVGMAAHTAFDSITKRRPGRAPVFDTWAFVEPALVAPIIFLTVRGVVGVGQFTFAALLLSFQNGFFWQTIFDKLRKRSN